MEQMSIRGYMCEVSWDGQTLRAKGTNKAAHRGLMGQNWDMTDDDRKAIVDRNIRDASDGESITVKDSAIAGAKSLSETISATLEIPDELVLHRDEFTVEKFKTGNPVVNGNLVLRASNGAQYQLHFRRKDNDAFTKLREALA